MSPTMNIIPTTPANSEKISIVIVSANAGDLARLRNILHHSDWNLVHCPTVSDARDHVSSNTTAAVITDASLSDGTWKDLLHVCETVSQPPMVLVTSRHADDRLWAEVLNIGGYDVLLKPFDPAEVARVVGMAWRCWMGTFRRTRASVRAQYASVYA